MKSQELLSSIHIACVPSAQLLLENIELKRKTITALLKDMERAEKNYDLNTAGNIKYNLIPPLEALILESKQGLLKLIAEKAFSIIDKL